MKSGLIDFFVTFATMSKDCNPLGHAYLLISQLDQRLGEDARLEILDTAGYYSRYLPLLKFKPMSYGRVREENPKFIVNKPGMFHKTFKINAEQLGQLLTAINHDRQMIAPGEKPLQNTDNAYKPGGPYFNIFRGKNCKSYALRKLAQIGLDVKSLGGFLQIPRCTYDVKPLAIQQGEREGKTIFYFDCPLIVANDNTEEFQSAKCLDVLLESVNKISTLLTHRQQTLYQQGKTGTEIDGALREIQSLQHQIAAIKSYPNRIEDPLIAQWSLKLQTIVVQCADALKQKNSEGNLITFMFDIIKEMWHSIHQILRNKPHTVTQPNSKDHHIMRKAAQHLPKVLPNYTLPRI